ncbi:RsbRD N-terminal domain-containing protein [Fundidesulfovibrio butyratiphilus]
MNVVLTLLAEQRGPIVKEWYNQVLDTYPPETAKLWKKSSDQFLNPVAWRLREGLEEVCSAVLDPKNQEALDKAMFALDEVVRVRAVQNFSPSGAAGFLVTFKKVLRERLWSEIKRREAWVDLLAVESFIDGLVLTCLDLYTACREKLNEIRVRELEKHQHLLLKHARLIVGVGEEEPAE